MKIFAEPASPAELTLSPEELEKLLAMPPKIYGHWVFPNASTQNKFIIAAYSNPSWFHRKMMKILLNFEWVPYVTH